MQTQTYAPKHEVQLEAVKWDGSTPHAYEIVAWILRGGGKARIVDGYAVQGPGLVHISKEKGDDDVVVNGSYVVRDGNTFFAVREKEFEQAWQVSSASPTVVKTLVARIGEGNSLVNLTNSTVGEAKIYGDRKVVIDLAETAGGKELYGYLVGEGFTSGVQFTVRKRVLRGVGEE